jgi:hypothetical protein
MTERAVQGAANLAGNAQRARFGAYRWDIDAFALDARREANKPFLSSIN